VMNPGGYPEPTLERVKAALEVPEGFTLTEGQEESWDASEPPYRTLELDKTDGSVSIQIVFDNPGNPKAYSTASGHVSFDTSKGRRTFDSRGVSDSFYINNPEREYRDEGDP